jgi:hypothetical protein
MPSTSVPGTFSGTPCPMQIRFGYVQGTSPATAEAILPGSVVPAIGSLQVLNIGPSVFCGFVIGQQYDLLSDTTTLQMVDWRDRLHDLHIAAAFNIQEDDGRFYHILPGFSWFAQRRVYVTREMGQADFDVFQSFPQFAFSSIQIAQNNLFSAATILNWMGRVLGFNITSDNLALQRLMRTYPLNLDWNNGSTKVIDAIQQIMAKCGTQFTCFGVNHMHISIRGWTENFLTEALASGLINPCLMGVSSGTTGVELNEQGRRVVLIGDRNKYEFVYPCRANWNPNWTWGMVFGGIEMGALLTSLGLTLEDKVGDLPERYHDYETLADYDAAGEGPLLARKTRNLMTIREYIEKVAFKVYVIDSRFAVADFQSVVKDTFIGDVYRLNQDLLTNVAAPFVGDLVNFPAGSGYNDPACNFHFPLSRNLVTDSNLQHITYATSRRIIRSADYPFGDQNVLVPMAKGTSLDVEEVTNPQTGQSEFRMRVFFNTPQFYMPPRVDYSDANSVMHDGVLVRLSIDADQFVYFQGDFTNSLRVRESVVNVRNLFNAFVDGLPATVLRENVRRDFLRGGGTISAQPVTAQQLAQRIATQLLSHFPITRSGSFTFDDICGSTPDGLIDSVSVSFDGTGAGIREVVNFTTGFADNKEFSNPFVVTVSRKFRDEEELVKDRLKDIAKAASKDKGVMGKVMPIIDAGLHEPGGLAGVPAAALAYAKGGVTDVDIPGAILSSGRFAPGGAVLTVWKPGSVGGAPVDPAELFVEE